MELDLDALQALCDAATPAPWSVSHFGFIDEDAKFIAAAREAPAQTDSARAGARSQGGSA